jgi:dTDP-glucose pyrophosphorylase
VSGTALLITMAGRGERFAGAGYPLPKYMIEAGGATLFELSLSGLPLAFFSRLVFVALASHEEKFGVSSFVREKLKGLGAQAAPGLVLLEGPTSGQAQTALAARRLLDPEEGLAIYNIDTYFRSGTLAATLADPAARADGIIGAFRLGRRDEKWSFARLGPDGSVAGTAEKEQISDLALTGFYHFSRAGDFLEAAGSAVGAGEKERGEYYVAPLYNRLISAGRRFTVDIARRIVPLGTPEDLRAVPPDLFRGGR